MASQPETQTNNVVEMSDEQKRQAIRERIEAGEASLAERQGKSFGEQAAEVRDAAVDFAKKHPVATVAGGVVLGIAISALFPRSPTRRAGREIGARSAALAAAAAELASVYGHKALYAVEDAGRASLETVEDWGDAIGDSGRSLRRSAGYYAASAGDGVRRNRRDLAKGTGRLARRTKARFAH